MGDNFAILDSDAGVFDGDEALVQLPHEWYYEIFDQPRGKPKGSLVVATWHYSFYRPKGKPVWYAHYGPARGAGEAFNERLHFSDGFSWSTFVINDGCTNLATRWYYFDTYLSA